MRYVPFDQATPEDYAEIGLMGGLEIHQQLLTARKLFCRCPAGIYQRGNWDAEILRHMRPTLSEMGEYDGTALMEFKTKKEIVYRIAKETVCTYEMDDTPPFMIDDEAVNIALEICMMLNLQLISEVHIARKQYLDGSIPTGFQRTTILGVAGWIPYGEDGRKIGITQLGLEEDSCREVADIGHTRIYTTDRLGMPLIETVTDPDCRVPQEWADVANILRRLVRASGKVRTGMGAARQDVNVSVRGGTRIEIKGVPRIPLIPILVHNEGFRQVNLLEIRDELHRRGITEQTFQYHADELTDLLKDTRFLPIKAAVSEGHRVMGVRLHGYQGILSHGTQPGRMFQREFSDRVRVVACIDQLPNIISTDIQEGNLTAVEWANVRKAMRASENDCVVLVWGSEMDTTTAVNEIRDRALEATMECPIPRETRQAFRDGTTGFERILPGADRMYPDTDLPPRAIAQEDLDRIAAQLKPQPWKREKTYREWGLCEPMVMRLAISPRADILDRVVAAGTDAKFAARILDEMWKHLRRQGVPVDDIPEAVLDSLFAMERDGRIMRNGFERILTAAAAGDHDLDAALPKLGLVPATPDEIAAPVQEAIASLDGLTFPNTAARDRYLMGTALKTLRLRTRGGEILAALRGKL